MRIFNIGIREVILLLVIMLLLFGPRQMQDNARSLAKGIRRFTRSKAWRSFLGMVDDVNSIKDQVIRESGIQEVQDSLRGINRQLNEIDSDLRNVNLADPEPLSDEALPSEPETEPETDSEEETTEAGEPDEQQ